MGVGAGVWACAIVLADVGTRAGEVGFFAPDIGALNSDLLFGNPGGRIGPGDEGRGGG